MINLYVHKWFFIPNIQKYDQRKFYFFSEKKHFQFWYSRSSLKKKSQKKFTIFFSYTKIAQRKNSQQAKFRIKNSAKYIISQKSNTKEIGENIVKKIFAEIFLWKEKFSPKQFDKNIFTKKKFIEKKCKKKFS